MTVRPRGSSFQADFMVSGKRYRENFTTEAEAQAWELKARAAIIEGKPVPSASGAGGAPQSTKRTLQGLLDHTDAVVWTANDSRDHSVRNAKCFIDWHGPALHPSSVTYEALSNFVVYAREALQNSTATINRKLAAISKMLHVAQDLQWITVVPKLPKQKEGQGGMDWLDFGEEGPIIRLLRHWGRLDETNLIQFLVDTAARINEALSLKWQDCKGRHATFWDTKSGKPRTVPLTAAAQAAIADQKRRLDNAEGPFLGLDYDGLRGLLRKVYDHLEGRYAKIEQPFHIYRHSCCARLVKQGIDIRRVKDWAGHATIQTTMRYAHLAPKELDVAVQALEPQTQRVAA